MSDILVIGSLNADLVVRAPRFPSPGETISGEDLAIIPGGKGANQAVAAARQGAQVSMLGRVGSDSFGPTLTDNLQQNHVDTTYVQTDASATGTAIIVVDANGQNSIVLSPGANGKVTSVDVDTFPFQNADTLLLQFEIPLETVIHAASVARQNGLRVILNPAPARPIPDSLLADVEWMLAKKRNWPAWLRASPSKLAWIHCPLLSKSGLLPERNEVQSKGALRPRARFTHPSAQRGLNFR